VHNSPRTWLGLLVLSLAVRLLVAWPLRQPGYADAYYYAVGARQLHAGQEFDEPCFSVVLLVSYAWQVQKR
jgi:hypothetical protein